MPNLETESLLRERIDDLSTLILIAASDAEAPAACPRTFPAALAELACQAAAFGYPEAARIAAELSAGPYAASEIQDGLARLQQALSAAAREPAEISPAPERPQAITSLAQDPELVADFVLESREHLGAIEQRLLTLEREPRDADAINSVFRGFHTIKGLAGFLEFAPIQEVAHEVETALNLAREGKLAFTPAVIDVILESVDCLTR